MRRLIIRCSRFWWSCDSWERGLWLGSWLLAFALVLGVAFKLAVRDGEDAPRSNVLDASAQPVPSDAEGLGEAAPPVEADSVQPTGNSPPTPQSPPPDERDCKDIAGIDFRNPADRDWFLANCVPLTSTASVATEAGSAPSGLAGESSDTSPPSVPPPLVESPLDAGPDASAEAIALAVRWLRREAPIVYDADAGSCTAMLMNNWVVTCEARLQGCSEAGCVRTVTVCVDGQLAAVRPAAQCSDAG